MVDSESCVHICKLYKNSDRANEITPLKLKSNILKKLWSSWITIHKNTPNSNYYMDSMAAVTTEKRKHALSKHWWIIHPFSYFRFLWDIVMTIVFIIAFITIPFMVSFIVMDYKVIRKDKVNIPIYAICWLDILCNCITGYYDQKKLDVELQLLPVLKRYFKGSFTIDVLSSLPYDHITFPWRRLPGNDSFHCVTLLNILPLLKLVRFHTLLSNIVHLYYYISMDHLYYKLTVIILTGYYIMFWLSCMCYLLPVLTLHFYNTPPEKCEDCWMTGIEDKGIAFAFQHAVFITLENLLTSGYGVFIPKTNIHILFNTVLMLFGKMVECYIIIVVIRIIAERNASRANFHGIMSQVRAYARQKQLPLRMHKRILKYYRYRLRDNYFKERKILGNLSEHLRDEIAMQSCRRLVENVTIFKDLPKEVIQSIIKHLKYELYLPADVIVKAGTQGDSMFFLSAGSVSILTPTGKEICHLDDGAHFGEVALLVPDQKRVASIVAIEVCEVYRLNRKDFRKCVTIHAELFSMIERIATERIERTIVVEEQHKKFLMRASESSANLLSKKKTRDRKI